LFSRACNTWPGIIPRIPPPSIARIFFTSVHKLQADSFKYPPAEDQEYFVLKIINGELRNTRLLQGDKFQEILLAFDMIIKIIAAHSSLGQLLCPSLQVQAAFIHYIFRRFTGLFYFYCKGLSG